MREIAEARRLWRRNPAHVGGKKSSRKGRRGEREAAKAILGERVPMSGVLEGLPNDVIAPNGWRGQVKVRKHGLERFYRALEDHEVLEVQGLLAMKVDTFNALVAGESLPRPVLMPSPGGMRTIRRWLAEEDADFLQFRADRKGWIVIIRSGSWSIVGRWDRTPRDLRDASWLRAIIQSIKESDGWLKM